MVRLIGFEWRKHFLKTSVIVAVLLFSVLNVVKIYSVYEGNSLLAYPHWKELYWKMYGDFGGPMTDEKIGKLMAIYRPLEQQTADRTASTTYRNANTYLTNVYEDFYFFDWNYVNPMKYAYDYKAYARDVAGAAKDNMDFYRSLGNSYEYHKNEAIAKLFQGRSVASFSYTEMYKYYVQYDFSALLVLFICLYGLMHVFLSEKETEMDTLLLTATAGGLKTIWAKLFASALFVCGVSFWFWLLDFAAFSAIFGFWDAASSPLYVLEDFIHASLNASLGQYALLSALAKTAGMLVFGLAFLLLSCLFRNALIPFIIGLFAAFGSIYLEESFMGSGRVLFKIVNPFALIVNRELFRKAEFLPLWDHPLPGYIAAFLFAAAWGAVFLCGILLFVRKNALAKGGEKRGVLDL
ncbi:MULTISPECIES: ABC transporter permease [unclassified Paenibacillus]|uniref:ABC transporter permease n=1 Tax=unclassified Paenibacillus TaxID=185978 RepID=UPI001C110B6E|nr:MULTISPECIES: ABC transporter permease [unclassified Paenibacillus]MBU5441518.1 ABC transporter permease [Paenibacillus sp. MSJ-34]CAH0117815.1 hypothetical protein PAE9249_00276 [Paenibacillus sp. CECT 9249]